MTPASTYTIIFVQQTFSCTCIGSLSYLSTLCDFHLFSSKIGRYTCPATSKSDFGLRVLQDSCSFGILASMDHPLRGMYDLYKKGISRISNPIIYWLDAHARARHSKSSPTTKTDGKKQYHIPASAFFPSLSRKMRLRRNVTSRG